MPSGARSTTTRAPRPSSTRSRAILEPCRARTVERRIRGIEGNDFRPQDRLPGRVSLHVRALRAKQLVDAQAAQVCQPTDSPRDVANRVSHITHGVGYRSRQLDARQVGHLHARQLGLRERHERYDRGNEQAIAHAAKLLECFAPRESGNSRGRKWHRRSLWT
jgi:hypothetical protein